jgi:hypothetical protein
MTDNNSPPSELMTFAEVKEYWRVSTNTAKKIIADLGIIRHRVGESQIYRYKRKDIESAVKAMNMSET